MADTPSPTKQALKAAYAALEVDRLHEMDPVKAVTYLRDHAALLERGNHVPHRSALFHEHADLIDEAIKQENAR